MTIEEAIRKVLDKHPHAQAHYEGENRPLRNWIDGDLRGLQDGCTPFYDGRDADLTSPIGLYVPNWNGDREDGVIWLGYGD